MYFFQVAASPIGPKQNKKTSKMLGGIQFVKSSTQTDVDINEVEPISYETPQQQFVSSKLNESDGLQGQSGLSFTSGNGNETTHNTPAQPILSNDEYQKLVCHS